MSTNIKPHETRAAGWYALTWSHITDWYRAYSMKGRGKEEKTPSYNAPSETHEKDKKDSNKSSENSEEKKLKEVIKESKNTLVESKTVFPFTLFPSSITVDRHKLTIVHRSFNAEQVVSVPIENIKNIRADLGPLFGSLTITSDHFINNTQELNFLKKDDAKKIQKLVQGVIVAVGEEIDISKVKASRLKGYLENLGDGNTETA